MRPVDHLGTITVIILPRYCQIMKQYKERKKKKKNKRKRKKKKKKNHKKKNTSYLQLQHEVVEMRPVDPLSAMTEIILLLPIVIAVVNKNNTT